MRGIRHYTSTMASDAEPGGAGPAAGASSLPPLPDSVLSTGMGDDLFMTPGTPLPMSLFDADLFGSPKKRSSAAAGFDDPRVEDENKALRMFVSNFKMASTIQPCAKCATNVHPVRECCGEKYCGMCDGVCIRCHAAAPFILLPPTCATMTCRNRVHGCHAIAMHPYPLIGLLQSDVTFLDVQKYAAESACGDLDRYHAKHCQHDMVFVACPDHAHVKKTDVVRTLANCPHCTGGAVALYFSKVKKLMTAIAASEVSDEIKSEISGLMSSI